MTKLGKDLDTIERGMVFELDFEYIVFGELGENYIILTIKNPHFNIFIPKVIEYSKHLGRAVSASPAETPFEDMEWDVVREEGC